ncbi:MAG TPA: HAD family phosphatase [Methylomirabilota bacterium]|nr:HAD family phosphatase [Methylomirabilota bacterium]
MSKQFAVFDIDGTIIRWQLYHAIGDALAKAGIIDMNHFEEVREARMAWKRREDEEQFRAYEAKLIQAFDAALVGMPVETLAQVTDKVFDEYKEQIYTYSRDLIQELKTKHYILFAISGSPNIIVEKLATYYGFDDYAGSEFLSKDGKFTGEINLSLGKKPALLKRLVEKHGADFAGSVGVGDSEGDIGMLDLVEKPIALNPSKLLFEHASKKQWQIVLERKNMIYQLESRDGSYVLAQTNAN